MAGRALTLRTLPRSCGDCASRSVAEQSAGYVRSLHVPVGRSPEECVTRSARELALLTAPTKSLVVRVDASITPSFAGPLPLSFTTAIRPGCHHDH
jgi:hypothetical protein